MAPRTLMNLLRRVLLAAATAALLASCAAYPDRKQERMDALPQRYSQFDVVPAWETKVVGDSTLVEGVVKNVRYAAMYDLEIWVAVLDNAGKAAGRSVSFVIPAQLNLDEAAEFGVKLPVAAAPGTRLRFTYKYRGTEGGEVGFGGGLRQGVNWMQSFDAAVP